MDTTRRIRHNPKTYYAESAVRAYPCGGGCVVVGVGRRSLYNTSFLFDLDKPTMRSLASSGPPPPDRRLSTCPFRKGRPGLGAVSRQCMSFLFTW